MTQCDNVTWWFGCVYITRFLYVNWFWYPHATYDEYFTISEIQIWLNLFYVVFYVWLMNLPGVKTFWRMWLKSISQIWYVIVCIHVLSSLWFFARFIDDNGTRMSVIQYFLEKSNIALQFTSLPAVLAGSEARPIYLPMEVLWSKDYFDFLCLGNNLFKT